MYFTKRLEMNHRSSRPHAFSAGRRRAKTYLCYFSKSPRFYVFLYCKLKIVGLFLKSRPEQQSSRRRLLEVRGEGSEAVLTKFLNSICVQLATHSCNCLLFWWQVARNNERRKEQGGQKESTRKPITAPPRRRNPGTTYYYANGGPSSTDRVRTSFPIEI